MVVRVKEEFAVAGGGLNGALRFCGGRVEEDASVLVVGVDVANPSIRVVVLVGIGRSRVSVVVGRSVVRVSAVHREAEANLLDVGKSGSLLGRRLGLGENWEKDGGKNRNDGDNDEQFDERKGFSHE